MTVLDALRHQVYQRWRTSARAYSLIGFLLVLLAGVYLGVVFLAAAWFYPTFLAEVAPGVDPAELLNEFLLYGFAGLTGMRALFQGSGGSNVRSYLHLPIQKGTLVRIQQATASLSLFNVIPLLFLLTLCISTIQPAVSTTGALTWGIGCIAALAVTQFLTSVLRVAWDRNALGVAVALGVLILLIAVGNLGGLGGIRAVSAWLFGGLSQGQILPLLLLLGVAVTFAVAAHSALRTQLPDLVEGTSSSGPARYGRLLQGRGGSPVTSLLLLEARLILRNKRTRQMSLISVIFVGVFLVIMLPEGSLDPFNKVLFGFLLSGFLGLNYTQYGYAWHGQYFDGLMARAIRPETLVRGQFAAFVSLCTLPLVLGTPFILAFNPSLLLVLGAFWLFHIGVSAPLLLAVAVFGRTSMELSVSTFFNSQGAAMHHFLVVLPLMGVPIVLAVLLSTSTTLLVVSALGTVGIALAPLWTRAVGQLLDRQRHAMAAGFRETD